MDSRIALVNDAIEKGEAVLTINLSTGQIESDKIKFLPWGKIKVWRAVQSLAFQYPLKGGLHE